MNTPDLKPCPFCNSDNVHLIIFIGKYRHVGCYDCMCDGPEASSKEQAVQLWNERAGGEKD